MNTTHLKAIPALAVCFLLLALTSPASAAVYQADMQERVGQALAPYELVTASVDNGVVTLNGSVTTQAQHDQIMSTVSGMDGVHSVRDNIQVVGFSPAASGVYAGDAGITANVQRALVNNYDIDVRNVQVETEGGVVRLTGKVAYQDQIESAREAASKVQGVIRVDNRLVADDK